MTPIVTVIYEDDSPVAATETDAAFRERIARELAGVERLPGTYPFTLDRSVKAYRLSTLPARADKALSTGGGSSPIRSPMFRGGGG